MQTLSPETLKVIEETKAQIQAEKEKQRVMRHVARRPVYVPKFFALTPEKRAYMKRFGSRPVKKRRN